MDDVISRYTQEQAIEDGILVKVGTCGKLRVVFTSNLFYDGYEEKEKRTELVKKGLEMLKQRDKEDTDYMKLRVIKKDKIWVILDGNGGRPSFSSHSFIRILRITGSFSCGNFTSYTYSLIWSPPYQLGRVVKNY